MSREGREGPGSARKLKLKLRLEQDKRREQMRGEELKRQAVRDVRQADGLRDKVSDSRRACELCLYVGDGS